MTTQDFITYLFCLVDDKLNKANKNHQHSQAKLYLSEVVISGLLFVLKDVGNRAFYRWIPQNHRDLFPSLPERTRLFRLFNSRHHLIGVIDTLTALNLSISDGKAEARNRLTERGFQISAGLSEESSVCFSII